MPDKTPDHLEPSLADTNHVIAAKDHLSGQHTLSENALTSVVNELLIDRQQVSVFLGNLQASIFILADRLLNTSEEAIEKAHESARNLRAKQ